MFERIKKLFNFHSDPYEKYKEQIEEAISEIKYFENKYNMSSEEFINKRYSRTCLDVESSDANEWATLYLTIGQFIEKIPIIKK